MKIVLNGSSFDISYKREKKAVRNYAPDRITACQSVAADLLQKCRYVTFLIACEI